MGINEEREDILRKKAAEAAAPRRIVRPDLAHVPPGVLLSNLGELERFLRDYESSIAGFPGATPYRMQMLNLGIATVAEIRRRGEIQRRKQHEQRKPDGAQPPPAGHPPA